MLKTISLVILVAFAAFVGALASTVRPAHPQEAICLTSDDALKAHPTSKAYVLEGDTLRQFEAAYNKRFDTFETFGTKMMFVEVTPGNWYMAFFEDNGCIIPQFSRVDITVVGSLLFGNRAHQ